MRIFGLICFLFMMGVCTHANAAPYDFNPALPDISKDYDFRNFIWGANRADVKKYETAILYKEQENSLYFLEKPTKRDFTRIVKYDFLQDSLVSAQYDFQDLTYPQPDNLVDLYESFKNKISKSLGVQETEDFIWRDNAYKKYPEHWSRAVRSGHLKIKSEWMFRKKTKVTLTLGYKDGYYQLTYAAEKFEGLGFLNPLSVGNISSFNVNP